MEYKLLRSRRGTVAIHITDDAGVEVRVPLGMPEGEIDRLVDSKEKWIREHLMSRERQLEAKSAFSLDYGDMLTLCGREYPLCSQDGGRVGFDGEHFYIPPGLSPEEIKQAAVQIYRRLAKNILTNKVIEYVGQMDVQPIAVKINGAKTRWGSCSGKNSLNFSWRLIMADEGIIDYVVVHELAHIKEHNHSPAFWAVVGGVFPDYELRKKGLRRLQEKLAGEDWE